MTRITVVQFCYLVAMFFALKLTTAASDELEKVLGLAVLDALERARVTVKEAAAVMRVDESQLRKQLRGEPNYHLSLTRLVRLPYVFWLWFGPTLMYVVAKKHMTEIGEDLGLRQKVGQ